MRIVIQRVAHASVTIEGEVKSAIKQGYLVLLGIEESDTSEDIDWLVRKVIGLRVLMMKPCHESFYHGHKRGNPSYQPIYPFASYKKGNRPSWLRAAKHEISVPLYEEFCKSSLKHLESL